MKIEIDLTKTGTEAEVLALQVAATAILRVLPQDAAEDALFDWCFLTGRDFTYVSPEDLARGRLVDAGEQPSGEISPTRKPNETAPSEPSGEISPPQETAGGSSGDRRETAGGSPSYEEFTFLDRRFSTKKRGPRAAVDHAVKAIDGCGSVAELDALASKIDALKGILVEVGRPELAGQVREHHAKARDAMADRDDEDGRAVPDTSITGPDSSPSEAEAGPDGEEAAPDSSPTAPDSDDIPFGEADEPAQGRLEVGSGEVQDRSEPPTPRAGNGAEEPLRDLMRRARAMLGDGRLRDILEHHGAEKLVDLDEAGAAAVRADVLADLNAAS